MLMNTARATRRGFLAIATAGVAIGLIACNRAPAPSGAVVAAPAKISPATSVASNAVAPAERAVPKGEAQGGDEPTIVFKDPSGLFSMEHPQSWGQSSQPGETIRFTGRDEFISVTLVNTPAAPLDFGRTDSATLPTASPGYRAGKLIPFKVAGKDGAKTTYTWQAGPSPVTGKLVPSSVDRYYIPGQPGKLAIFTYSCPTRSYDPAGADDFANAFRWLK